MPCLRREDSCRKDAKVPVAMTAVSSFFALVDVERVCMFLPSKGIRASPSCLVSSTGSHAQHVNR